MIQLQTNICWPSTEMVLARAIIHVRIVDFIFEISYFRRGVFHTMYQYNLPVFVRYINHSRISCLSGSFSYTLNIVYNRSRISYEYILGSLSLVMPVPTEDVGKSRP